MFLVNKLESPRGGIGRHKGLKILALFGSNGSSPFEGTKNSGFFYEFINFQNIINSYTSRTFKIRLV